MSLEPTANESCLLVVKKASVFRLLKNYSVKFAVKSSSVWLTLFEFLRDQKSDMFHVQSRTLQSLRGAVFGGKSVSLHKTALSDFKITVNSGGNVHVYLYVYSVTYVVHMF